MASSLAETALGLVVVLGLGALLTIALYARRGYVVPTRGPMRFSEHLQELGTRVVRVAALWAYWAVVLLVVRFDVVRVRSVPVPSPRLAIFDNAASQVYLWLADRTKPAGVELLAVKPTDAVGALLGVAFLVAFLLALPALAFEVWAFFSPGMTRRERRTLLQALPAAFVLFFLGAAFAIQYVVPLLLATLYAFAEPLGATTYLTVGSLVTQVVFFSFVFGFAFQLPLVLVMLVRLRITTPSKYLEYWRHATVVLFFVAALASDPTLVSQLIIGAMLLALYWGGVLASYLLRPPPRAS